MKLNIRRLHEISISRVARRLIKNEQERAKQVELEKAIHAATAGILEFQRETKNLIKVARVLTQK